MTGRRKTSHKTKEIINKFEDLNLSNDNQKLNRDSSRNSNIQQIQKLKNSNKVSQKSGIVPNNHKISTKSPETKSFKSTNPHQNHIQQSIKHPPYSRRDHSEAISLCHPQTKLSSSIYGAIDSKISKLSSPISSLISWNTTGLYKIFIQNFTKLPSPSHPSQSLSDNVFNHYYTEKVQMIPFRSKDILKYSHAISALSYVKNQIKQRYSKSGGDSELCNESEEEFLRKTRNYFEYGMETLRYLMDLMKANERFRKIESSYDGGNLEDVVKWLIRWWKIYEGIEWGRQGYFWDFGWREKCGFNEVFS